MEHVDLHDAEFHISLTYMMVCLLALGLCSMLACGQSDSTGTIAAPVDGGQLGDASASDVTAPMEDAQPETSQVTPDAPEDTPLEDLPPADIHDDEVQDDAPSDVMNAETGELDSGQDALPGDVSAEDGGEMDTAADADPRASARRACPRRSRSEVPPPRRRWRRDDRVGIVRRPARPGPPPSRRAPRDGVPPVAFVRGSSRGVRRRRRPGKGRATRRGRRRVDRGRRRR